MELGDKVTYYTHEATDTGPDSVRDELAFVTGKVDEEGNCIDVVVFPPLGPLRFERVCKYDPEHLYNVSGGRYFRDSGDPPDFDKEMPYSANPEWNALLSRQIAERNNAANQQVQDGLLDKHKREQDELRTKLDARYNVPANEPKNKPKKEVQDDFPNRHNDNPNREVRR